MTDSPLESPLGAEEKVNFARMAIEAQERGLETVVIPLLTHVDESLKEQEKLLMRVVGKLIKHAKKQVAKQQALLDEIVDKLIGEARTRVSTQNAMMGGLGGTQTDQGQGYFVNGGGPPPVPPPPGNIGGNGGGGNWCIRAWDSGGGIICYLTGRQGEIPDKPWLTEIEYTCGFATQDDAENSAQRPPRSYNPQIECPPEPPPPPPPAVEGPRGILPPQDISVEIPPPEPPPPPIFIPPPREIEGDIIVPPPPPPENCPPFDPCFPQPPQLIDSETFTATPFLAPFWLRAKCTGRCTAIIECYQGDCPPSPEAGWLTWGPYNGGCPGRHERELIVRCCLPDSPCQDGGVIIPPIEPPDWVNPPPIQEPPPPDPPPPGECPQPKPIRPELRIEEYVPPCRTYEQWTEPYTHGLAQYADLAGVMREVRANLPDEIYIPSHWKGE